MRAPTPVPNPRRSPSLSLCFSLGLGLTACARFQPAPTPTPETWWTDAAPDEALLQVDRDFAAMSVRDGAVAAFRRYAAESIVDLPSNRDTTTGAAALLAHLAAIGDNVMTWQVAHAEVARSGERGLTYGSWQVHRYIAGGPILNQGSYLTVWRRQPDGQWKAVIDIADTGRVGFPPLSPGRLHLRLDSLSEPGDGGRG